MLAEMAKKRLGLAQRGKAGAKMHKFETDSNAWETPSVEILSGRAGICDRPGKKHRDSG
jgi:hypothetical protein